MTKLLVFVEKRLYVWLACILVAVCLYQWQFPEWVQEENGLGWDGEAYASIIKEFEYAFAENKINSYYFQRIFPMALAYGLLQLSGLPVTDTAIINSFVTLNIGLIVLSFLVWIRLCRNMQLSTQGKILSFTGIFVNYALLKMPFYYPVLTDLIAFTLGLIMFYCFLQNNSLGLILTSVVGAFSFPTLFYCGMVLYVFPKEMHMDSEVKTYSHWNKWLAASGVVLFLIIFLIARFVKDKPYINPAGPLVFILSFAIALAYIYYIIYFVAKPGAYLMALRRGRVWYRIGMAGVLFILITLAIRYFAAAEQPILNYKGFLANVVIEAITNPLVFLVAHFIYFGPVFLLLLYFRKDFLAAVNAYGTGFHLFVLIYLLVGAGSESRQFINAWPVFVLVLCAALEKYRFSGFFLVIVMAISLAVSKFWYRINQQPFSGEFLDFPYQHYFMSQGPWMSDAMYLLQGGLTLAVFGLLYLFFLRKYKQPITHH